MYEILERDKTKDVSVEIEVQDGSYRDDGIYEIRSFNVLGCTILGNGVLPAIDNSRVEFNFSVTKDEEYESIDELNDELAKKCGPFKKLDELKADIKKNIEMQNTHKLEEKYKDD